jgi:hypothetical protein
MGSDRRANTSRNSRDELLIEWTGSCFCNPGSPTDDNDDESNRHRHRAPPYTPHHQTLKAIRRANLALAGKPFIPLFPSTSLPARLLMGLW